MVGRADRRSSGGLRLDTVAGRGLTWRAIMPTAGESMRRVAGVADGACPFWVVPAVGGTLLVLSWLFGKDRGRNKA
jgi:hypothetical protein